MQTIERLALIGGGNMATALVSGLLRQGMRPEKLIVADPNLDQQRALNSAFGIKVTGNNALAIKDVDALILAVKPQLLRTVAQDLAPHLGDPSPLVISIAA